MEPDPSCVRAGFRNRLYEGNDNTAEASADDNLERWRDAAYSFRHTPRVTPLRRTGQLLDGRQPFPYWIMEGLPVIQAQSEEVERGLYLHLLLVEVGSRWPLKSSPSMCRRLCLQIWGAGSMPLAGRTSSRTLGGSWAQVS